MPRKSRSTSQLSEEEKIKRRREQKKISIRRVRARMSQTDLEERRRKDRERYHKKKEQGLIKTIKDFTPREQRQIRKLWREKAKKKREKQKIHNAAHDFVEINTPPSTPTLSRASVGSTISQRNKRRLKNENIYLKKKICELESKLAKYRMRCIRARKKMNEEKKKERRPKRIGDRETKKAVRDFLLQDEYRTIDVNCKPVDNSKSLDISEAPNTPEVPEAPNTPEASTVSISPGFSDRLTPEVSTEASEQNVRPNKRVQPKGELEAEWLQAAGLGSLAAPYQAGQEVTEAQLGEAVRPLPREQAAAVRRRVRRLNRTVRRKRAASRAKKPDIRDVFRDLEEWPEDESCVDIESVPEPQLKRLPPLLWLELTALFDRYSLPFHKRKPPKKKRKEGIIESLCQLIEREWYGDRASVEAALRRASSHDVAAVFKRLLRDLPQPPLTQELMRLFYHTYALSGTTQGRVLNLLVLLLPPEQRATLRELLQLARHIVAQHHRNKMTDHNASDSLETQLATAANSCHVTEALMRWCDRLWTAPAALLTAAASRKPPHHHRRPQI
ncbi:unnamed protein product [Chilo suppressalis]|uniref:Rho-GAP domain-containing protein n=1 Tax=Chilo suppressalis TaxID=168631 RepID=A0ABN8BFU4_CHISP|nr:unnamed protein product [Chilo suppressalis]